MTLPSKKPVSQLVPVGFLLVLGLLLAAGCSRPVAQAASVDKGAAAILHDSLSLRGGAGSASAGPADLGEPNGFATLKGKFVLNGAPPARAALKVDKDMQVCAPGGRQVMEQSIVVGSDGGLANVLIFLATPVPKDDPKWEHESYQAAKTSEVLFDQKECVFLTHVFGMRSTQVMKVKNSDPVGHNTNLDSSRGAAAFNRLIAGNGTETYRPGKASPAPFPVSCSIHPWMKAWLMVSDNPYFAVTNEHGEFEIANVPSGVQLEFRVWQERATLQQVTVNGESVKWPKGKMAITLQPDETKELQVAVDASLFQ